MTADDRELMILNAEMMHSDIEALVEENKLYKRGWQEAMRSVNSLRAQNRVLRESPIRLERMLLLGALNHIHTILTDDVHMATVTEAEIDSVVTTTLAAVGARAYKRIERNNVMAGLQAAIAFSSR